MEKWVKGRTMDHSVSTNAFLVGGGLTTLTSILKLVFGHLRGIQINEEPLESTTPLSTKGTSKQ